MQQESYATHREVELLNALRSFGGTARTSNLAEKLNVSEETVRRTTKALAKTGVERRVHGGVYLVTQEANKPVSSCMSRRAAEKSKIAKAAAALIPNGSCLFLDVGSTTAHVAKALKKHQDLTVVTNGLLVAQAMVAPKENRVFLAGGELRDVEGGAFGPETLAYVKQFNLDTAVLSVDGIDERGNFLLAGSLEASLARSIAKQARRIMIVADHTKFGFSAPIVACEPRNVDLMVSDARPPAPFKALLERWDIEVLVAGP